MSLTRKQAIKSHRKMWNWIADETEKRRKKVYKEDYFEEKGIKDIPYLECYCCEYNQQNYQKYCGENCIINWGNTDIIGDTKDCTNSYYEYWSFEEDWQEAARLAREIANLPERRADEYIIRNKGKHMNDALIEKQKVNLNKLFQLIKENPELPIVPMVDSDIVADDCYRRWMSSWRNAEIDKYICVNERIHFYSDEDFEIVENFVSEETYMSMSDTELVQAFENLNWTEAIIVDINLPD